MVRRYRKKRTKRNFKKKNGFAKDAYQEHYPSMVSQQK